MENVIVKNIAFNSTELKIQVEISKEEYADIIWKDEFENEVSRLIEDSPWKEFKDYLEFNYCRIHDIWVRCEKRWYILIPVRGLTIGW